MESTLQMEIEVLRKKLNQAAARDLGSEECVRLSLKLDALLEQYYNEEHSWFWWMECLRLSVLFRDWQPESYHYCPDTWMVPDSYHVCTAVTKYRTDIILSGTANTISIRQKRQMRNVVSARMRQRRRLWSGKFWPGKFWFDKLQSRRSFCFDKNVRLPEAEMVYPSGRMMTRRVWLPDITDGCQADKRIVSAQLNKFRFKRMSVRTFSFYCVTIF